ncbi:hypothetical protein Hanom_Chr04g00338371 [Helianthus anomalus]
MKCLMNMYMQLTLCFGIFVGKSTFRKQFFGKVLLLISRRMAFIMGKQASAANVKSLILLIPPTLKINNEEGVWG